MLRTSDVNPSLYRMQRQQLVSKVVEQPAEWLATMVQMIPPGQGPSQGQNFARAAPHRGRGMPPFRGFHSNTTRAETSTMETGEGSGFQGGPSQGHSFARAAPHRGNGIPPFRGLQSNRTTAETSAMETGEGSGFQGSAPGSYPGSYEAPEAASAESADPMEDDGLEQREGDVIVEDDDNEESDHENDKSNAQSSHDSEGTDDQNSNNSVPQMQRKPPLPPHLLSDAIQQVSSLLGQVKTESVESSLNTKPSVEPADLRSESPVPVVKSEVVPQDTSDEDSQPSENKSSAAVELLNAMQRTAAGATVKRINVPNFSLGSDPSLNRRSTTVPPSPFELLGKARPAAVSRPPDMPLPLGSSKHLLLPFILLPSAVFILGSFSLSDPLLEGMSQSLPELSSETFASINKNPISALMEFAQSRKMTATIECVRQWGPSHNPRCGIPLKFTCPTHEYS